MIRIRGAREHNLANIDVDIPRNKLTVISGLSGSGKSSLAFDTLYAEGQRRYVESLSAYARQFLDRIGKPDVDSIEGLSPAISIDQKTTSRNPRSTVGTVTEIYDYLRLLYARIGKPFCPDCGTPITPMSVEEIVDLLLERYEGKKARLLAVLERNRKGTHNKLFDRLRRDGYLRVTVDNEEHFLEQLEGLVKNNPHDIDLIVDRVVIRKKDRSRLFASVETALKEGNGVLDVALLDEDIKERFSEHNACLACGKGFPELTPQLFSFNSPQGACLSCDGLGETWVIDEQLVVREPQKSLLDGAIGFFAAGGEGYVGQVFRSLAEHFAFDPRTPFENIDPKVRQEILYGTKRSVQFRLQNKRGTATYAYEKIYAGIIPEMERRLKETTSGRVRSEIEKYMRRATCGLCHGERLNAFARTVSIDGHTLGSLVEDEIGTLLPKLETWQLTARDQTIAAKIVQEVRERLSFLIHVGLDYVTLARSAHTLSGGEAQRIRLATQIGSKLVGVLYVLDEPSIGLHQADQAKLIETLQALRDLGNTIVVVEHDEETIRSADYLVDLGPGAGIGGGQLMASGTPQEVAMVEESVTGRYLSGKHELPSPLPVMPSGMLRLEGCTLHNLQNIDLGLPLGQLICITGLSGSGKSSLIMDTLYPALAAELHNSRRQAGTYQRLAGHHLIQKVLEIDQGPIGRTPRSNPATYSGVFSDIRALFGQVPEARMRGYAPGRFSFNVKGGRCEACEGDGYTRIEMHFLPDIFVECEICHGARYNRETLEIKYRGKSIVDVLDMEIDEALVFYDSIPKIRRRLDVLQQVGLGYVRLGQSATTLSGGEAQRLKLARELSLKQSEHTLYILDEPTTGLHFEDVYRLINVLQALVERGNSVVVIEHNLDLVAAANHIIDLGPAGGRRGGRIVATGTPQEISKTKDSHTGRFLDHYLHQHRKTARG